MLAPGTLLTPNLRLLRVLGTGGMGSVWLASHLTLHTEVVVKLMRPELAREPETLARFSREAASAANVKDDEARRVDLPEELPAPVGSTVTARPVAGKGYPGLAKLGGVLGGLGFLGLLVGVPFAITGGIIASDTSTTSTTGHDFLVAGLVTSGIAAVFLAGGLALSFTNRAPGLMMETAPAPGARAWLTPLGVAGTF